MKTDDDLMLAERFAAIADRADDSDWDDVVRRRAALARRPRRRTPSLRLAALFAALVVVVAVALVAPWSGSRGSLIDRALAAIGSQPVLHVIGERLGTAQQHVVDIQSGRVESKPLVVREEIWYDQARGLKHTITRVDGSLVDDVLETPRGGYTPGGIVYDCAWIAAHPVEATKLRVSCNASLENGTTPHKVPRPKPTLAPGLAGFLDGYQQALSSGSAREIGKGQLDGQTVDWLEFKTNGGTERVALDPSTHKPVLVEDGSGWSLRIAAIETVAASAADFSRPTPNELGAQPTFVARTDTQALPSDASAIATVPGAVWAGPSLAELPLAAAQRTQLKATFVNGTPEPQTGVGLELDYGTLKSNGRLDRSRPFVQIEEAPSRALAFGYMWGFVRGAEPPAGKLYEPSGVSPLGFTVSNNRYLTIQASSPELLRAAAQALHPASS
jgi:hypothetical protein